MLVQEGTTELSLEPQHWGAFLYEDLEENISNQYLMRPRSCPFSSTIFSITISLSVLDEYLGQQSREILLSPEQQSYSVLLKLHWA